MCSPFLKFILYTILFSISCIVHILKVIHDYIETYASFINYLTALLELIDVSMGLWKA